METNGLVTKYINTLIMLYGEKEEYGEELKKYKNLVNNTMSERKNATENPDFDDEGRR